MPPAFPAVFLQNSKIIWKLIFVYQKGYIKKIISISCLYITSVACTHVTLTHTVTPVSRKSAMHTYQWYTVIIMLLSNINKVWVCPLWYFDHFYLLSLLECITIPNDCGWKPHDSSQGVCDKRPSGLAQDFRLHLCSLQIFTTRVARRQCCQSVHYKLIYICIYNSIYHQ